MQRAADHGKQIMPESSWIQRCSCASSHSVTVMPRATADVDARREAA